MLMTGDYIAGFVEGEGCFALNVAKEIKKNRRGGERTYFWWRPQFAIVLRSDDEQILRAIQQAMYCGSITYQRKGAIVRYAVQNIDELYRHVIPFFEKHHLYGKKRKDFVFWAEAVKILYQNRSLKNAQRGKRGFVAKTWDPGSLSRLLEIYEGMRPLKAKGRSGKWITDILNNRGEE